jgi:aryl-alcohol dehydrogenase-like predicted oxidoreductase
MSAVHACASRRSASVATISGRIDLEASHAVVHAALDAGITMFDTADVYGEMGGSETALGEILGPRRKDIVLATKFAMPMNAEGTLKGASRRYIMTAVEASLKRLRTDWIDLYQQHTPDPLTPVEETLRAGGPDPRRQDPLCRMQ